MLLLGIDIGTSSVKVSVVDAETQQTIVSAQYPETEAPIISHQSGWAEQNPDTWWEYLQHALMEANVSGKYDPKEIAAIAILPQRLLPCLKAYSGILKKMKYPKM